MSRLSRLRDRNSKLLATLLFAGLPCFVATACGVSDPSAPPSGSDRKLVWSGDSASNSAKEEPPAPPASSSALVVASASGSAAPVASASATAHVVDPQNKSKPPLQSDALNDAGRRLFEAIKADDPKVAADFFFPKDPFIPLKDIKNPGKYWDQLFRTYEHDIHELHRKRGKEMADAQFDSFELGSAPTWVKPGEEANKIGYFRTFNGKLRYKTAAGKVSTIEVKVIISWDEHWYITHLLPWKK